MLPGQSVELIDDSSAVIRPARLLSVAVRQCTFGPRRSVPLQSLLFEVQCIEPPFTELTENDTDAPVAHDYPLSVQASNLRQAKGAVALLTCSNCVYELEQLIETITSDIPLANGTCVEILDHSMGGWTRGEVIKHNILDGKYVVRLEASPETELLALEKHVRARDPSVPSFSECLKSTLVQVSDLTFPSEVIEWMKGDSNYSIFNKFLYDELWTRTGVIWSSIRDNEEHPFLRLIGSEGSLDAAEPLIQSYLKKVLDLIAFTERRSRRLKLLEERRPIQDSAEKTEFFVHDSLVGLVIGKQGENLSRIARTHNVEIRVFPDEVGVRRLRIYGNDASRVNRAREELDFQYLEIPLPPEHSESFLGWLSRERQVVRDLSHRHNLHSLWMDNKKGSLTICGLRKNIQDFLRAIAQLHTDSKNGNASSFNSPLTVPPSTNSRTSRTPSPLLSTGAAPPPRSLVSTMSPSLGSTDPSWKQGGGRGSGGEVYLSGGAAHRSNRDTPSPQIWPYPSSAGNHSASMVSSQRSADRCPPAPYNPPAQEHYQRAHTYGAPKYQSAYPVHYGPSNPSSMGPPPPSHHHANNNYPPPNHHPLLHHPQEFQHQGGYYTTNLLPPPHQQQQRDAYYAARNKPQNPAAQWGWQQAQNHRGRGGGAWAGPPPPPTNMLAWE